MGRCFGAGKLSGGAFAQYLIGLARVRIAYFVLGGIYSPLTRLCFFLPWQRIKCGVDKTPDAACGAGGQKNRPQALSRCERPMKTRAFWILWRRFFSVQPPSRLFIFVQTIVFLVETCPSSPFQAATRFGFAGQCCRHWCQYRWLFCFATRFGAPPTVTATFQS